MIGRRRRSPWILNFWWLFLLGWVVWGGWLWAFPFGFLLLFWVMPWLLTSIFIDDEDAYSAERRKRKAEDEAFYAYRQSPFSARYGSHNAPADPYERYYERYEEDLYEDRLEEDYLDTADGERLRIIDDDGKPPTRLTIG